MGCNGTYWRYYWDIYIYIFIYIYIERERRDGEMERWRDGEMERWRDATGRIDR